MEYIFLNEILARLREEDEESLVMIWAISLYVLNMYLGKQYI
jgi:hypothetical protein